MLLFTNLKFISKNFSGNKSSCGITMLFGEYIFDFSKNNPTALKNLWYLLLLVFQIFAKFRSMAWFSLAFPSYCCGCGRLSVLTGSQGCCHWTVPCFLPMFLMDCLSSVYWLIKVTCIYNNLYCYIGCKYLLLVCCLVFLSSVYNVFCHLKNLNFEMVKAVAFLSCWKYHGYLESLLV